MANSGPHLHSKIPCETRNIVRFVDEFRDPERVHSCAAEIRSLTTQPWTIMEICGGQTHSIVRYGLDQLLPDGLTLVHGPGCPVCVTPVEMINKAIDIASQPDVILCSYGDMLRVPGSGRDLLSAKALGADIRIVYSPLDAIKTARANPGKQVVFFAVGFETTAPANGMSILQAAREGLGNYSMLATHVRVPPAMRAILTSQGTRIQGFLAAGHVCTVMGIDEYLPIAKEFHVPIVVTGFEPLDVLQGIAECVRQLEQGRAEVSNQYSRVVRSEGNPHARRVIEEVFEIVPRNWRGIGTFPESGLGISSKYRDYDAESRFGPALPLPERDTPCISGLVLQGLKSPSDCSSFGSLCTPEHPLGATMVSAEGACAAYYKYRCPHPAQ